MRGSILSRVAGTVLLSVTLLGCGLTPVSAPVVPPGRSCQGLAPNLCQQELENREGSRPGQRIVAFHMRCTVAVCDARSGDAEVQVAWSDGSTEMYGTGWAGAEPAVPGVAEPAPSLPVQPECAGVPEARCLQMASAAAETAGGVDIAAIRIACTRPAGCDERVGEGEAVVRRTDDSEMRSTWGYAD